MVAVIRDGAEPEIKLFQVMRVMKAVYKRQVRMLLQPLVENAIRYGLGNDEKIPIQVFEDNIRGLAGITILDSGNGLTLSLIHI